MVICLVNMLCIQIFFYDLFIYRFTIYKVHKPSKKKREKSSAKKERKATKTLAIVLGKIFANLDYISMGNSNKLPGFTGNKKKKKTRRATETFCKFLKKWKLFDLKRK